MQPSSPRKSEALIAFGANQGNCEAALKQTVGTLENDPHILELKCSRAVQTKAVTGQSAGESEQNEYLNAAIRVLTTWTVDELHQAMIQIEKDLGRDREERWGPRTIDLDLLLLGDLQLRRDDLIVPHPRMSFRRFVLQPALDIAENMVHPESGMTLKQLVDHLDQSEPRVVIVTNDSSFADSDFSQLSQTTDCEVQIVKTVPEFMAQAGNSKLVVSCIDESKIDPETEKLIRFAYNFAGPTLRIDQTLGENVAMKELRAAVEAMQ